MERNRVIVQIPKNAPKSCRPRLSGTVRALPTRRMAGLSMDGSGKLGRQWVWNHTVTSDTPVLPIVTGLMVSLRFYRVMSHKFLAYLITKKLPKLRDIRIEQWTWLDLKGGWRGAPSRTTRLKRMNRQRFFLKKKRRLTTSLLGLMANLSQRNWPVWKSLRSLSLFHEPNRWQGHERHCDIDNREHDGLSDNVFLPQFIEASRNLRVLSMTGTVTASDFFMEVSRCPEEYKASAHEPPYYFPNLVKLAL